MSGSLSLQNSQKRLRSGRTIDFQQPGESHDGCSDDSSAKTRQKSLRNNRTISLQERWENQDGSPAAESYFASTQGIRQQTFPEEHPSRETIPPRQWIPSMTTRTVLESPDHYSIGWIAALPIEHVAATALLDERHDPPHGFLQQPDDTNSYTWGRMGNHNIVIATLAVEVYGTTSDATPASSLLSSLPHIKIGLLVGIGSGIARPKYGADIRLGDIVVSQPDGITGGVVQYDLGKANSNNTWERKRSSNMPPPVLLHALSNLQTGHESEEPMIPSILSKMLSDMPLLAKQDSGYIYQGIKNDQLFKASYRHAGGRDCHSCDPDMEIRRDMRDSTNPVIHYGIIASANMRVNDAAARDKVADDVGGKCLCIETEAAGFMDHFPCLVITGICDYADSHKNDRWQRYASATAAAFGRELLAYVSVRDHQETQRVVDNLEHCLDYDELQIVLRSLPRTSSETYSRTLMSVPEGQKEQTIRILQFLTYSERPLTVEEAVDAIAIRLHPHGQFDPKYRLPIPNEITRFCSSLVSFVTRKAAGLTVTELKLAHPSVREYLISGNAPEPFRYQLSEPYSRGCITRSCLAYLTYLTAGESISNITAKYPLARYSAEYWMDHAKPAETLNDVRETIMDFFQNHTACTIWSRLYNPDCPWDKYPETYTIYPLYLASLKGLEIIAQMLLHSGADVDAQGGLYGNALQAASVGGYDNIVGLLVKMGADVNARGGLYGNALQAASIGSYDKIVEMLLDSGADIDAQGGPYGNALQAAASKGNDKIVQMLLDRGVDVNAQGGPYGNALQAAASKGNEKIVQVLLERGADVNAQDSLYGNALQAASIEGYYNILLLLLYHGADIDAQGGPYGNALQAAASEGNDKIVQMLLDCGVDVNAQGGPYGNALQAAASRGNDKIVQMLLQMGAKTEAADKNDRTPLWRAALNEAQAEPPDAQQDEGDIPDNITDDTYSDSGSLKDSEDIFTEEFANWFFGWISQKLGELLAGDLLEVFSHEVLKEFAIRFGHEGKTKGHQRIMYLVHKPAAHERVISLLETAREPRENRNDTSWKGRVDAWELEGSTGFGEHAENEATNASQHELLNEIDDILTFSEEQRRNEPTNQYDAYRELLDGAETSDWLSSTIDRHLRLRGIVSSDRMSIRNTVLRTLRTRSRHAHDRKISYRRPPPIRTTQFRVEWDPRAFVDEVSLDASDDHIARFLTITGDVDSDTLQALPCQEYMAQVWSHSRLPQLLTDEQGRPDIMATQDTSEGDHSIGPESEHGPPARRKDEVPMLSLICRLLAAPSEYHREELQWGSSIEARLDNGELCLKVHGTDYDAAEIAEQIAWLGSALRDPKNRPISVYHAELTAESPGQTTTPNCISFRVRFVEDIFNPDDVGRSENRPQTKSRTLCNGRCWTKLFSFTTIARGFPIPSRPNAPGLDIPLHLAADIIGADKVVPFHSRLLMKGFSAMLFPTYVDWVGDQAHTIVWHFIEKEDGSRISYADRRIYHGEDASKLGIDKLIHEHLDKARHVVGWSEEIENVTGTRTADYPGIQHANLGQPSPYSAWGIKSFSATISSGKAVLPVANMTVNLTRDKRIRVFNQGNKKTLQSRLEALDNHPVILHDVRDSVRRAWLVDGFSALMHLFWSSYQQDCSGSFGQTYWPSMTLDEPSSAEGYKRREISARILDGRNNLKELRHKYYFEDRVTELLDKLELIIDDRVATKDRNDEGVGFNYRNDRMEGFDFLDVANRVTNLTTRVVKLKPDGTRWCEFAREIRAIPLFGEGFGELLRPVNSAIDSCGRCLWNARVPEGRDILAAEMDLLNHLHRNNSEWGDSSTNRWLIGKDGLTFSWQNPAKCFVRCPNAQACPGLERIQKIKKIGSRPIEDGLKKLFSGLRSHGEQTCDTEDGWTNFEQTLKKGGVLWGKPLRDPRPAAAAQQVGQEASSQNIEASCAPITPHAPRVPVWQIVMGGQETTANAQYE